MSSCPDCGNRDGLCQRCRMEDLETRHGTPAGDDGSTWVLGEMWHASMWFDDARHTCACGTTVDVPLNWSSKDLRYVSDKYDAPVCDDCIEYLEEADDSRLETLPDGGEFSKASKLRADGGEVDVYQWVLENVHEYPAGTDSRWGSRGNLVHQGRKLDGVSKEDVQKAIARAVDNENLLSWHGLLARAEIDRLRELVRVEHEEHDITRQILVGKCNKLIATKKQEQADGESKPEVATDGGRVQSTDDTERSGELERFAVERALYAAWTTELWIPADPDYGFIDYFEAAATRNLSLLHGFEELAEDVDRRGIVPQSDSDQAKLVTDGGQSTSGTERLERVEYHLHGILSELDADEMETQDRVAVEHACQDIHVAFGGEDAESIYRDLHPETERGGGSP